MAFDEFAAFTARLATPKRRATTLTLRTVRSRAVVAVAAVVGFVTVVMVREGPDDRSAML